MTKGLKVKKFPDLDGSLNFVWKAAILAFPYMSWIALQKCLDWKIQKLVLLLKPNNPPGDPVFYRPIFLLDRLGKLLEKITLNRLVKRTVSENGPVRQLGFWKGKSAVDAIQTVIENAEKVSKQKRSGNRCYRYEERI